MKARHELITEMARARPLVHIVVEWEEDPNHVWDGDGSDPVEDGEIAHDVTVVAQTIMFGRMIEGVSGLGGSYSPRGGPHCPDIHGYFPQMLHEAVAALDAEIAAI
ncbi:MAG: hypothetical protein GY851_21745 [bacterium]|nr:hypothetical protein [bacterium]